MSKVYSKRRGITWNISHQLEDLDYVDDVCLLSNMQTKLEELERQVRHVGLELNKTRTKAMRINNVSTDNQSITSIASAVWAV